MLVSQYVGSHLTRSARTNIELYCAAHGGRTGRSTIRAWRSPQQKTKQKAPETLGKLMPELFQEAVASKQPTEEIIEPDAVADTYYMLHKQPRSAWTFDMDIRPWTTSPWFNSP